MEKMKLIERRKSKGFSQREVARMLFMDVSNYNRRERGVVKISLREWEILADIMQTSVEDIYESNDNQDIRYKDSSILHSQEKDRIYSEPEHLLEIQRKYIEKLENEIRKLRNGS